MHSPCQQCFSRGFSYSPESNFCKNCEYNIAIKLLKSVLMRHEYCKFCKNRADTTGEYCKCKLNSDICNAENDFSIDWEYLIKDYLGNI